MGLGVLPMMGIGAGLGLLTGGTKGALRGAALGGIGGGINNLASTGSLLGASPVGAKVAEAGMAANAPFAGAVFNPTTGTYLNPDYFVGASSFMPTFTGGQGLVSNALSDLSNYIPSSLTNNLTPQNMLGVASLLGQQQRPTMLPAPQSASQTSGGRPVEYTPMATTRLLETPRRKLIG
jgi:hypothetical protein